MNNSVSFRNIFISLFLAALYMQCFSALGQPVRKFPFLSKPGKYIFFPLIVKSPEYKWGAGVGGMFYFRLTHDTTTRTSNTKLVSFVTLRKQIVIASEGNIYFPAEHYILHYIASYSHFPDRFWGLGNETVNSAMEKYTIGQYEIYPQLLREIVPHLFFGMGYDFQHVFAFHYNENGQSLFVQENINGREGSVTSGTGLILTWDNRNNAFSSTKGFYFQYFNNFYRDFLGSQFNFIVQNMDVRKYFGFKKNRSLAFQLNLQYATGDVPIRNLSIIGSDSFMRGYYAGRFQDNAMFALQGEYRTPVYKRWGVTLFSGMGKVAPTIDHALDFTRLKVSAGIGLRYAINPKERLNLRFDQGFGMMKSYGSYINLGEAF